MFTCVVCVQAKDDVKTLAEDIKEGSSQLSSMRLKSENLKYERHTLLLQCKVDYHFSN